MTAGTASDILVDAYREASSMEVRGLVTCLETVTLMYCSRPTVMKQRLPGLVKGKWTRG